MNDRALEDRTEAWMIWSGEHCAWWRSGGHGYAIGIGGAGRWTLEDAEAMTRHCGPEKKIKIVAEPGVHRWVNEG